MSYGYLPEKIANDLKKKHREEIISSMKEHSSELDLQKMIDEKVDLELIEEALKAGVKDNDCFRFCQSQKQFDLLIQFFKPKELRNKFVLENIEKSFNGQDTKYALEQLIIKGHIEGINFLIDRGGSPLNLERKIFPEFISVFREAVKRYCSKNQIEFNEDLVQKRLLQHHRQLGWH